MVKIGADCMGANTVGRVKADAGTGHLPSKPLFCGDCEGAARVMVARRSGRSDRATILNCSKSQGEGSGQEVR